MRFTHNASPQQRNLTMIFTRLFLSILLIFPLFVNAQTADDGVFIYTVWYKHTFTHQMNILLNDTLFIYNKIGVEKIMRSNDLIKDNKFSTTTSLETYYRIDFDKREFQDIGKELIYTKEAQLPFTSPKMGIDFRYKYYNGEKYIATDTTIDHNPCKVIRYVGSADSPLKDAQITLVFLNMENKFIHIIPNLEDTFNGRLLRLEANDDNDGRSVVVMEHIPQLSDYWKEIISR